MRDTLKVTGIPGWAKPTAALFWVDMRDAMAGGTGHTVRVCEQAGVPFVFQDAWLHWLPQPTSVNYATVALAPARERPRKTH
jgi:hypothetical protein